MKFGAFLSEQDQEETTKLARRMIVERGQTPVGFP
jgi:hypothetical protein